MSDIQPGPCSVCGTDLSIGDFKRDRAMLLFGKRYCTVCLEAQTLSCRFCKKSLHAKDFEEGRALTLLGRKYCENCLDRAVKESHKGGGEAPAAPPPKDEPALPAPGTVGDAWDAHRTHARFIPPVECKLVLKRDGLRGLLGGNVLKLWVDISEGGLRVVAGGAYKIDDILSGQLVYAPLNLSLSFRGTVRHAKPSERFPGAMLVGVRFDHPSQELQAFIRDVMGSNPSLAPAPPRSRPATQVPPPKRPATQVPPPRPSTSRSA